MPGLDLEDDLNELNDAINDLSDRYGETTTDGYRVANSVEYAPIIEESDLAVDDGPGVCPGDVQGID